MSMKGTMLYLLIGLMRRDVQQREENSVVVMVKLSGTITEDAISMMCSS